MVNMQELVRDGFKIINGRLCDRYGNSKFGAVDVFEFGWGKPCTEYKFDLYELKDYVIRKDVHYDRWCLVRGYTEVCELKYLGGKNWMSKFL